MTLAPIVQTVALVGSYVPRKCGIATFTKDLRDALAAEANHPQTLVLSMDDTPEGYPYPPEVRFQIQAGKPRDYALAADLLNINQTDIVILQHEFGIFGGPSGRLILDLVHRHRMPLVTTLHTVLRDPTREQAGIIVELLDRSDRVVVMSDLARRILETRYHAPPETIALIPHGIPDVPFVDPAFYKDQFGLERRTVLMTFGLLSPGKGIEVAIRAMPRIAARHPEVMYVILGAVHPHVFKREGNAYLTSLERLAARLGVADHVVFHSRYVTLEELIRYLGAVDLYLTPYPHKEQIVSGTLAYALGMGKAVVSTPYWYAEEMLADGRGRLFPFGDSEALAAAVNELLDDPVARNAMRKRAYMYCRNMVWKEVARSYLQVAADILADRRARPRPVSGFRPRRSVLTGIPEVNLNHLRALTDDTGVLQHAVYCVPDRHHGYCTDDNARALLVAVQYHALAGEDIVLPLVNTYLSFLHYAFNPETKRFRNFMSYDRKWLEAVGAEDVQGRAIWALGKTVALAPNNAVLSFASRLFNEAVAGAEALRSPRAWAFALVGIHAYLERFGGDAFARRARAELARRLFDLFRENACEDWPWCENIVTYVNAKLPHALILSGQWLFDRAMIEQGLRSLEWLVRLQGADDGVVSLIGNQGWLQRDGARARFDQQPIEAMALVEACAEAWRCTQDETWLERARQCLGWFLGSNDTQSTLYDFSTGGCRDGLHPDGPNLNEGAESTLAWLLALLTYREFEGVRAAPSEDHVPALRTEGEGAAASAGMHLEVTGTNPDGASD